MSLSKPFPAIALCFLLSLPALPPAAFSQELPPQPSPDFAGIEQNLSALESLIADTLNNNEALTRQLRDLKANLQTQEALLNEREASMTAQEHLLKELRSDLTEMSEIYKEQSDLSKSYERSSRFWKTFSLIAVPATALLSGSLTALILSR
jgi:septal ring factor EnvC (AmiA/AmiB activator)